MTDFPDGSGQIRRPQRMSDGGAPVSGALAIVLAAVAVVVGFLILRSISDGGDSELEFGADTSGADDGTADGGTGGDETTSGGTTAPTLAPTTTTEPFVTQGASVIVANANSQGGSASSMTRELETGPGFIMEDPVNASSTVGDIDTSVVYHDPTNTAAEAVANSVARAIGGAEVIPLSGDPPTADGTLGGAGVLLMLGEDKANRTLDELNPATAGGGPAVTNPDVATDSSTPSG
jgi:hypothetical protein